MQRRDFITSSFMGSLCAFSFLGKSWATSPLSIPPLNNHQEFLNFIDKSKKKFSSITISGIDPTVDFIHNKQNGDIGATKPGIAFFNDDHENIILNVPVFPHSIEQNPSNLNRVMLIPRRWPVCVEFDVVENKIVSELTLKEKKFYGHGCYIPGTDLFYATTFEKFPANSSLILFDLKSKSIVREVEIEGASGAHQCSLSRDGKYIIVTLSRGTEKFGPSIVWLDAVSGKVVNRVFGVKKHAEHFSELNDNFLIFTGGVSLSNEQTVLGSITPEKKVNNFEIDKDLLKYFGGLSVSICGLPEKELSFMTNVVQNSVYVLNYKTGKLINRIEVSHPRGLNLSNDKKFLFVTSFASPENKNSDIFVINIETLKIVDSFSIKNALAYSSHANPFRLI